MKRVCASKPSAVSANTSGWCAIRQPESGPGSSSSASSSSLRTSKTAKPPCGRPVKWSWKTGIPRRGSPMYSFSASFAARALTSSGASA
ncbi:MAG: hypothetical protein M3321_11390 [Actinomycetota bacterium]|nr:hypothetical protein [Actinomycetota bacterium]